MKLTSLFVTTLAICALSFTMCSNDSKPTNSAELRKEIEAQWETFIQFWEAENADGLIKLYAEDATNIPPNAAPKQGHAEIKAFYNMLFEANASSAYNHEIQEIHVNGNSATEYGHFSVDWERNDGTSWTFNARSMTYWTKSDGQWKIQMFLFNNPPEE